MRKSVGTLLFCVSTLPARFSRPKGPLPRGVPRLDHVFVILESHAYRQIVGNPNARFANSYMTSASTAKNCFTVGHLSLTNYLEIVGGSTFGIRSDNGPDWHNTVCTPLTVPPTSNFDNLNGGPFCPIYGIGPDDDAPAIDNLGNECMAACPLSTSTVPRSS